MNKLATIKVIKNIFSWKGNKSYMIGEDITQYQHAIQSYLWMKNSKRCPHMRSTAFLHDIGHLIIDSSNRPDDNRHEIIGSEWLKTMGFSPYVYEPVKLHVAAKRYMVTLQKDYYDNLSQASKITFGLQGGFMTYNEITKFENNPFFLQALFLRECDDKAKNICEFILTPELEKEIDTDLQMSIISHSHLEERKIEL